MLAPRPARSESAAPDRFRVQPAGGGGRGKEGVEGEVDRVADGGVRLQGVEREGVRAVDVERERRGGVEWRGS